MEHIEFVLSLSILANIILVLLIRDEVKSYIFFILCIIIFILYL